jgi:hypothetical protein
MAVAVESPFGTGRLQHAAGFGLPAGLLAPALQLAIPRTLVGARLGVHILFFIFARDAMSPAGFWQLGAGSKRLTAPAPSVLWGVLGAAVITVVAASLKTVLGLPSLPKPDAAFVAAVLFSLCHAWLAMIVTRVGLPVLVFTLIEGLVAGLVYRRAGLPAAALAHGLSIAALASGLY